jgi:NTE family protein
MSNPDSRKTVSLVLGSGAARGLAHIGVIEWLNNNDYRISSISGASMGALVGGMYAAGELDAFKRWVIALEKSDVARFLDLAFSSQGLFKGDRLMDTLREMVGDRNIEDLPIAYTAVATDLERQREIWLAEGSLFEAIRASIAIPTVFTPHPYKGLKLLDGGLLNPVPIAPTFRDLTDMTIAVNLNALREKWGEPEEAVNTTQPDTEKDSNGNRYHERVKQFLDGIQATLIDHGRTDLGMFDLLSSSFETMQNAIASMKLASYAPDVLVDIPRSSCKAYEFYRAREMIELGYRMAGEAMGKQR